MLDITPRINALPHSDGIPVVEMMPNYWQLLSPSDLQEYLEIRKEFYDANRKFRKGERLEGFLERLRVIRQFVEHSESNAWCRSLVCGLFFLNNGLAINIQQLKILFGKCKSSINGSLQQLGYITQSPGSSLERDLYEMIPLENKERSDLKKWTIRINTAANKATPVKVPMISVPSTPQSDPPSPNYVGEDPSSQIEIFCPIKLKPRIYKLLYSSTGVQTDS